MAARLVAGLAAVCAAFAAPAGAEALRIATYTPDLSRKGPGLLLRDLQGGKDKQIAAVVQVIAQAAPDVIVLTGFDWDYDGRALETFAQVLTQAGADYPHRYASRPNSGMTTGFDLDQDGRLGGARDAQGFGRFPGEGGMAVLSRHPFGQITDYSAMLWRDLPGNLMPPTPAPVAEIQRLSTVAHWDIEVLAGGQPLHLLAYGATPPVFDGPEDRNGRRNHDETAFWLTHQPDAPFVVIGDANLDPVDGEGRAQAITALIAALQDPQPRSEGGRLAPQDGVNARQKGDPSLDTAVWGGQTAGNMRVDYILPAPGLRVLDAGVFWPAPGDPMAETVAQASRHRLVWVDLDWP